MDGHVATCKQCAQVITQDSNCIGCEGFCTDVYHASCVKMRYEELVKYRSSRNLWWMCTSCSDMMVKKRNNRHALVKGAETKAPEAKEITRIDDEIAALKKQITAIHESLANSTVSSSRIVPSVDPSIRDRSTTTESSLGVQHDTQLGTKATDCFSNIVEQRSANDRFWLFLSRIKSCVSEREVFKLVADALGTDDIIVKKLVPAWKDSISMPFISFKVGINAHLKRTALLPSTWPCGLHFREFRNNYWEPLLARKE